MARTQRRIADRRRFLIGCAAFAAPGVLAPVLDHVAAQSPSAGGGLRPLQELQALEENAQRAGVRAAIQPRVTLSVEEQNTYSELMPRLVHLIERASSAGPGGQEVAEAASELLSRVNRAERGEQPDDLPRRSPPEFGDLQKAYREQFQTCTIVPERRSKVDAQSQLLLKYRPRYETVADKLGIPWYFIGLIHALEASFNFNGHLHNGDYPLTRRTVHVPANRPPVWAPPSDWESSAEDALRMKGYDKQSDWSLERMLYRWEAYNGFGYHYRSTPTPYLWSFSNHYAKGKFVSDGKWDPNYVSQQCGAAVVLKGLLEAGTVTMQ